LNNYEKSFILRTRRLKAAGIDFQDLAREALTAKFGGAADVLLRDLSSRALDEPEYFVQEMSRIFGMGAIGFLDPIIKYGEQGLFSPGMDSPALGLIRQLGPSTSTDFYEDGIYLHEHRIKDEQGNYSDNAE